MCLIIMLAFPRLFKSTIYQVLGKPSPSIIGRLLFYQGSQIHSSIEAVSFGSRIAYETLVVKLFGHGHSRLTVHLEETTGHLLELNCCQRQWFPFARCPLLHFSDFSDLCRDASLEEDDNDSTIEQTIASPVENNVDIVSSMCDFNAPERFRYEILYFEVAIDDKPERWKLAGS